MSPVFDDAYPQEAHDSDADREFDYAIRFESTRRKTKSAKPSRSKRPSYSRRGKAPAMHNGMHRRRRSKIRW